MADMAMEIELARNMVYKAAWLKDNKKTFCKGSGIRQAFCK
ncbi:acyl-CoA dehydrogenase family protein [Peribacillus frigoritolerans]|nr:acyl-CoA dehydrogenase family protein [Peribacillus frigoritolerans]